MNTAKFVLWIVLALATVPAGNWLGNYLEQQRTDNLFKDWNEQEAISKARREGFQAAQKAELEQFRTENAGRLQAATENVWASAYEALSLGMTKGAVTRFLGAPVGSQAQFGQIETVSYKGDIIVTFEAGRLVGKTRL